MSDVTPFTQRVRESLREDLLAATADLLPERGFARLRMADVAAATGVSRQTVYNEFGSKQALVEAVAIRTAAEFLEGIDARLRGARELLAGLRDAVSFALRHAAENRLIASVLGTSTPGEASAGSDAATDLLPFLTTRSLPVLRPSVHLVRMALCERLPTMDDATAELLAENTVRLVLSHLVLPTAPPEHAADDLVRFLAPVIELYQSR